MYPRVLNIFAGLYFGDERKKTNKKTGVFDEEHFYFSYIPINKRKRGGGKRILLDLLLNRVLRALSLANSVRTRSKFIVEAKCVLYTQKSMFYIIQYNK